MRVSSVGGQRYHRDGVLLLLLLLLLVMRMTAASRSVRRQTVGLGEGGARPMCSAAKYGRTRNAQADDDGAVEEQYDDEGNDRVGRQFDGLERKAPQVDESQTHRRSATGAVQ